MKWIFVSALFFIFVVGFAQLDSTSVENYRFSRLKVLMILEDTTAYPCPCGGSENYRLYKFRIAKIYYGEPDRNLIGVCAPEEDILQFNPLKEKGEEYWWSVCRECIVSGLPVYILCGKF